MPWQAHSTGSEQAADGNAEESLSFSRTVHIADEVQTDKVAATYENGVLTVTLPKREEVKPQLRLGFEERDVVKIISGPFADFNGTITEINLDQSKLKVLVNIFDRETPVELGFDQVSKV